MSHRWTPEPRARQAALMRKLRDALEAQAEVLAERRDAILPKR